MSERAVVLATASLPPGGRAGVTAFGTQVALFNVNGNLYALANTCPHYGAPLCHGRITGTRVADEPYESRWVLEDRVLICPWHGWEFDLATGRSLFDPSIRVQTFEVEEEDGMLVLERRRAD